MATVRQPDPLWTQQIGLHTGILRGAPGHLILGSELLANKASRCSSVRRPALQLPRKCVVGDGFSSDGRCQEQEHLWQQLFLDPTMWWDNRRDKRSSRWPDFRRKGSGEVLWLNKFKPAWVDEQLVSLDMEMGDDASPSKSSFLDDSEPGRRTESEMGSRCTSVRSPALPLVRNCVSGDAFCNDGRRQEQEHLWQQFFLDPTMWWDNRRDKKSSRSPDFRRKGSGEVLWLNSMFKPAWVDEELVSLDMQMGQGASPSESSFPDKPEPGRCAGSEMGVVTAATVSTFCEQGKLPEAVGALESLAQTDSAISPSLFCTVLKLCTATKDLVVGRRVHNRIVKLGCEADAYLGNHILRMYACGGRLEEAMDVFTRIGKPDVITWGSIISANAKHGKPKEAIQLYHEMRSSGVKANGHVFVAALQACASAADLESGRKVHCDVLHSDIPTNLFVGNCLVDMYAKCGEMKNARQVFDTMATKDVVTWNALISGYAKCGELKDAHHVFDSMDTKNVVSWNALIAGYAEQGHGHEALVLYGQMEQDGLILADHVTFACLLKACASSVALQKGRQLHSLIVERGLLDNVVLGNCLVDMYAKCGELEDARQVFDSMNTKNVVTWNALISGYAKSGELKDARQVFDSMATKDVVTWTSLIAGYAQQGLGQEALLVFEQMEQEGLILANHFTFSCLLKACANTGALHKGRQLHSQIVERGLLDNVVLGNCLVDMYAKCGELEGARQVFDSMNTKDVVTWTALISGYGSCDDGHKALGCFEDMLVAGIQPNDATFTCLLVACSHEGLVHEGRKHFDSMAQQHGIKPTLEHYNCMIDLLGRAGHLDEAEKMLLSCESQSNVVGLTSLLNACKSHGDIERAMWCFESIVRLDPQESAAYVLMANAYADAGMWADVDRIETQRMVAGANKLPAVASIEVNKQVHQFLVGERRGDIALKVESTNARLKQEGGHVPHTKLVLKPVCEKEKEDVLCGHAEKLALAFGLLNTPSGTPLVVTKNLRMCSDCHSSTEIMSRLEQRDIVVRDGYRVHRFAAGCCSCKGRP